jgi:hypothetical protein
MKQIHPSLANVFGPVILLAPVTAGITPAGLSPLADAFCREKKTPTGSEQSTFL